MSTNNDINTHRLDNLIRWTCMGILLILAALSMALLVHSIRVGDVLDVILAAVAALGTATGFCALLDGGDQS
ncbi:hypothetical protein [Actinobaculum sp. 352]|uniref:hypothetical protein n=1 Tax=Actinobaculum sp. 352 TaxID=2490946 RepID=UPI0013E00BDA|nr:hypothetical protein [Actinobaculum sp. 352]